MVSTTRQQQIGTAQSTNSINAAQQQLRMEKTLLKRGVDARLVLKNTKDLSDSNTPTVAVATTIQPIADDIATQLALPSKESCRSDSFSSSYQSLDYRQGHFCSNLKRI